jgi:sugar O-acyltransferase (sialic acid O-acetyltransferase NeuD family)
MELATACADWEDPMGTVIIGCGGHGRVVLDIYRQARNADPVGFLDGNPDTHGCRIDGLEVLGDPSDITSLSRRGVDSAIVAIGDNATRNMYAQTLSTGGMRLETLVHPKATVADTAKLGRNVVVCAGAVICAHCRIGDSCIINTACIVDHESAIGRAAHLCPGSRLAGRVKVEDFAFVGIGATIIQCLTIGRGSVVGAGAVVLRDVPAFTTVVGVPARAIREAADAMEPRPAAKHIRIA